MSGLEQSSMEGEEDRAWEVYVEKLKAFLGKEATTFESGAHTGESEMFDGNHEAAQALEAIDDGDFEAASVYLDSQIEAAHREQGAETDQKRQAYWEIRLSDLEKLKDGLERQ
jgi:hypothetical protein